VQSASGGTPTSVSGDTDWSIFRAYTSLYNAEAGTENTAIDTAVQNFDTWTGGADLVANNYIWNIALYADATDTTAVTIDGWTTNSNNYLRIYTPTSTSEVGVSQRHNGTPGSGFSIYSTTGTVIGIVSSYTVIEGLEIYSDGTQDGIGAGSSLSDAVILSFNLIHDINKGISLSRSNGGAFKAYNNIIYDSADASIEANGTEITGFYVYNNTVYNSSYHGIYARNSATIVAKNNIVLNSANSDFKNISVSVGSDYNVSSDGSAPGANSKTCTVSFIDSANDNYHLSGSDTCAKDSGTDLSSDSNLSFSTDIDGDSRPYNSTWDIGADEYVPSPNYAPTITSVSDSPDPVIPGTFINFSVDWSDANAGEQVKIHICKTDSFSTSTLTCTGGSWCDLGQFTTSDPAECNYLAQNSDISTSPNNYYAFVCDDDNACSSSTAGTFTVSTSSAAVNTVNIKGGIFKIRGGKVKIK
jgi:parallel beta-helix repeat protein